MIKVQKLNTVKMAYYTYMYIGKFGVVHRGKLVAGDGNPKVVAIKTIKCKLLS